MLVYFYLVGNLISLVHQSVCLDYGTYHQFRNVGSLVVVARIEIRYGGLPFCLADYSMAL